jgi:1,4-alpha-glucan branching enzyme
MTHGKGLLNILLHAHLPFIKHPEYDSFLEENWLFEAITESYLPQLRMVNKLKSESIPINLTFSFSPTLIAMLQDDLLKERYRRFLQNHLELGEKELVRTKGLEPQHTVAQRYVDNYRDCLEAFDTKYGGDILKGFDQLQKQGFIEIITTPGSYPFLPFYQQYPQNIAAHIEAAIDTYHLTFGKTPLGLWLPECGYYPGLEHILADYDISYFFSSAHGLLFSDNPPEWGVFAPAKTPRGVSFFARDLASADLVWSPLTGYPGDPEYRDFYRDIGYDLDLDYVKSYIHLEEFRINTGFKYYAVSGKGDDKHLYDPAKAAERIKEHAGNFLYHQSKRIKKLLSVMGHQPIITCPYTAELFGHWWYEGIDWLETVIRYTHSNYGELELVTPSGYLEHNSPACETQPIFSSWGNKGYAEVWLEGSNDWIYRHIHMAIERLQELISRFPDATGLKERALNQACREVLLSQAIDWPVIMRSGTSEEYAASRIREHISNFYRIYDAMSQGTLGTEWLTKVEKKHNVFPRLNYKVFLPQQELL